jgi:hypothetical protein
MTYVIAFNHLGVSSIVSDARRRWAGSPDGENTALKTGLLFRGCTFGRSGDAEHGRRFILAAKTELSQHTDSSVIDLWQVFKRSVSEHNLSNGDGFEMLLSVRLPSGPALYLLDSRQGLSRCKSEWVSIGKGKDLLDSAIDQGYTGSVDTIREALKRESIPENAWPYIFPYFICLWLSELAEGYSRAKLESYGVGGPFHFVYQTSDLELPQRPSLYVLSDLDQRNDNIYHWMHRVCYTEYALAVETYVPLGQIRNAPGGGWKPSFFLDTASCRDLPTLEKFDLAMQDESLSQGLHKEIARQVASLPFYYFCGFGFVNPEYRGKYMFHVAGSGEEYMVTRQGVIADRCNVFIEERLHRPA